MRNKSTYKGHCQACGRLQMLPGGLLSKHGYNITHGFFSGVCKGAGYKPYEQNKDLLLVLIESAQKELELENKVQEVLRSDVTEPKCWYHVYHDGRNQFRGYYNWEYGELQWADSSSEYSKLNFVYNNNVLRLHIHARSDSVLLDLAKKYNISYADWKAHHVRSLKNYIEWQSNRLNNWKPNQPLIELVVIDKEGFVPEKAPW